MNIRDVKEAFQLLAHHFSEKKNHLDDDFHHVSQSEFQQAFVSPRIPERAKLVIRTLFWEDIYAKISKLQIHGEQRQDQVSMRDLFVAGMGKGFNDEPIEQWITALQLIAFKTLWYETECDKPYSFSYRSDMAQETLDRYARQIDFAGAQVLMESNFRKLQEVPISQRNQIADYVAQTAVPRTAKSYKKASPTTSDYIVEGAIYVIIPDSHTAILVNPACGSTVLDELFHESCHVKDRDDIRIGTEIKKILETTGHMSPYRIQQAWTKLMEYTAECKCVMQQMNFHRQQRRDKDQCPVDLHQRSFAMLLSHIISLDHLLSQIDELAPLAAPSIRNLAYGHIRSVYEKLGAQTKLSLRQLLNDYGFAHIL